MKFLTSITLFFLISITSQANTINGTTLEIRQLLLDRQYSQLNKKLNQYSMDAINDINLENKLFAAYRTFEDEYNDLETLIDDWIVATPADYQPYLARSFYLFAQAWKVRGGKWASETKLKNMMTMESILEQASTDLTKVLSLYKNSVLVYYLQLRISNTLGKNQEYTLLQKGLIIIPKSFRLRRQYLLSIIPRWGGSFKKMQNYIEEVRPLFNDNLHLKPLEGIRFKEAGDIQYSQKAYQGAIKLYTKSLSFGENHHVLIKRGRAYYKREEYQRALTDMNKAIQLFSEDGNYYYHRAFVHKRLGDLESDIKDTQQALKFSPNKHSYLKHRNRIVSDLNQKAKKTLESGNTHQAENLYKKSLNINPEARTHSLLALAQIKQNNIKDATHNIKKSIEIEPDEYYYYNLMDWTLTKNKDWAQIINYWDKYIAMKPKDDRALVQQSGAYYHQGNIKKAVTQAKKAADMGNAQGQEIYDKYKHLLD